jgi:DNA-binding CsgD family transcriptional regulator
LTKRRALIRDAGRLLRNASELLDFVPWPVVITGEDRLISFVNAAARSDVKSASLPMIGKRMGYLLAPKQQDAFAAHGAKWLKGDLYPVRLEWPSQAGTLTFLATPLLFSAGGSTSLVIVFQPADQLAAALAGEPKRAASKARAFIQSLEAEVARLREQQRVGNVPGRDGDSGLLKLTQREWDVARRIASGDRVSLLAEELAISPNTVRNHLKSIFRKLGVRSQAQLVRRVRRS